VNEPVRVISDLHLGHRVSRIERVESLRPLISGAGTVVFNGDTWQELAKDLREKSQTLLDQLQDLCREEGCQPIFLPGNHDPGWPGKGYLELFEGKVVITHGDALLRAGSPWKREILTGAEMVDAIWESHPNAVTDAGERHLVAREIAAVLPSLTHPKGRKIWQRAFDAVTPPQRGIEMIKAWTGQKKSGLDFCDRYFPRAKFLLIGHFHWGGSWESHGRHVINTGSFLNPGRAYWVEIGEGSLACGRIDETSDACRKGRELRRWVL
jgi:UDP-2,3-diacylglucosamine pyrophosphatase LpxH